MSTNTSAKVVFKYFMTLNKMGKSFNRQETGLSLEDNRPGCMDGIFYPFHNHKRLQVKKRLAYKKHSVGKPTIVIADADHSINNTSEITEMQDTADSAIKSPKVDTKPMDPSPTHKSSMKSRIKALFTEDMSKKKNRHRRTASCPVRTELERTNSEPSNLNEKNSNNEVMKPPLPKVQEEHSRSKSSCDFCETMLTPIKPLVRDQALLQHELVNPIERSKYALIQDSKLFWDALDLLNMRKELFLKVLNDPSSSLAHQLHSRRKSSNMKVGLTKSISFPAVGSLDRRILNSSNYGSCQKEDDELEVTEPSILQDVELSHKNYHTSANMLRKRRDNKIALKRFKFIRDKIKHVIRDTKKDKHWIIMDGVLHKIPYGRGGSKDIVKEDKSVKSSPRSSFENGKSSINSLKRASSLSERANHYDQILETTVGKEGKDRKMGRICSLPDLWSYVYFHTDDSPSMNILEDNVSVRLAEEKLLDVISENEIEEDKLEDDLDTEENACDSCMDLQEKKNVDVEENLDYSAELKTEENVPYGDHNIQLENISLPQPLNSTHQEEIIEEILTVPVLEEDNSSIMDHQDPPNTDPDHVSKSRSNSIQSQVQQLYEDLFHVQINVKNKPEYNYVKDVLELSGFSRSELLGKWHSPDRPVDPLVFDEVEDCQVAQPECSGCETCDHLLLFNLINEVLLNIYERSFCYWPMPLSCGSRIHRMPMGYHVLEEVWGEISWFLSWRPENDQSIDDAVGRDLGKGNGWMNLQFDAECVGLEVEDLIFDDLLEELVLHLK